MAAARAFKKKPANRTHNKKRINETMLHFLSANQIAASEARLWHARRFKPDLYPCAKRPPSVASIKTRIVLFQFEERKALRCGSQMESGGTVGEWSWSLVNPWSARLALLARALRRAGRALQLR
ncbi:MAG: hypothetical protein ACRD82_19750, partial [Blastocatellia bacterium]